MRATILAIITCTIGCANGLGGIQQDEVSQDPAPPAVSTNLQAYSAGQEIDVTWSGLPGNDHDWVAYAPAGSPPTTVTRWSYAGGRALGLANFQGATPGVYVARTFLNDSYMQLAESPAFTVGAGTTPAVTTTKFSVQTALNPVYGQPLQSGASFLVQLPVPIGVTLTAVRMDVADSQGAPHVVELHEGVAGGFLHVAASSTISTGSQTQLLTAPGSIATTSGHVYEVLLTGPSNGSLFVWDGEIDYY